MLNTVNDSSTSQESSSPQSPRSDLQTTNQQQQKTASPTQSSAVTQDQLSTDKLRVGTSSTTVQNSTSTPPNVILGHDILNAAWLWLIVPIALAIFLFKPQKKPAAVGKTSSITVTRPTTPVQKPTVTEEAPAPSVSPATESVDTQEATVEANDTVPVADEQPAPVPAVAPTAPAKKHKKKKSKK